MGRCPAGCVVNEAVECAYTVEGDGPPLFLIHGIGASRRAWAQVTLELAAHYRCISYDLRGHGESPKPAGEYRLEHLVADLERLRAHLDIDDAHFAGHSLGGMIGPAYARAHPHRVRSLGLLSTAAGRTPEDSRKVRGVVEAMEQNGIGEVLETLVDRWFTDDCLRDRRDIVDRRLQQVMDTDPQVFLNVFHIYAETEMEPWLHEIDAPCLVLTGELDGGCNPRLNRLIADRLPNAELVILEGLKHAVLLEAPAQVAAHLSAFLERQERAAPPLS